MNKIPIEKAAPESVFSKEQIVSSKRFSHRRDLLEAVLDSGRKYTFDEAEKLADDYMKGKVK